MTNEFGMLSVAYLICITFVATLLYQEFQRKRFNFNILFSLLYLLTFYFGYPLTCLLAIQFDVNTVETEYLFYALLSATIFYAIYSLVYRLRLSKQTTNNSSAWLTMSRIEAYWTSGLLCIVALTALLWFFMQNGVLLFKLTAYNQIFSKNVSSVALKRFFYFFIPAMLIVYFIKPSKLNWFAFLATTLVFGIITYMVVGGTRANIMIALALFLFIGIVEGYIKLWMMVTAGCAGIIVMFWLALKRYGLDVSGNQAFYTFLYLTRDTFSPWENLALLLQKYQSIEFQGLAPIARDFYVFIPDWLWPERPNLIVNSANYFTWNVLNYHAGLAISPTLIGSMLVMGGVLMIPVGAIAVGLIIKWFDWLYEKGKNDINRYRGAVIQGFCFGAIFNLMVLVREGADAFTSRIVFFCLVFGLCLLVAKLFYWLCLSAGVIKSRL